MVNKVRTRHAKFPGHFFQPLTILNIIFYYKSNRNLYQIKELSCPVPYTTIPYQTKKSCIAMFVAEVLYKTLHEESGNSALFDFVLNMLQILDMKNEGTANFHLMFLLHYSRFLGIFPAGLLDEGKLAEREDLQIFDNLPADARQAVIKMLQWPVVQPEDIKINNKIRSLILERLLNYYSLHMEGSFKLKSLPVLREVFK